MDLDAPTILQPAYADAAAHVLTAALRDDPGFTHVLTDARVRQDALQAFYGFIVRDAFRFGRVLAVRDAVGIAGVAISYPPGAHPLPVRRKLGAFPSMASILARSPRQVLAFAQLGSAIDAAFPRDPVTYIEALGVRPDAQHRGHGRRLMARVLADADHARADCYLETSRAVNVPYYESMGFESLGAFAPLRHGGPPEARMRRARPA
ncbi:MAG TPA: GNAT family N-acetyltransferase [Cellulomonas sp.]